MLLLVLGNVIEVMASMKRSRTSHFANNGTIVFIEIEI
jgi:hypothetical protein